MTPDRPLLEDAAGIAPLDADDIADFLAARPDQAWYDLHTADTTHRGYAPRLDEAARDRRRLAYLTPDGDRESVSLESITAVVPTDPAATPPLPARVDHDPATVAVAEVLAGIDAGGSTRQTAVDALTTLATARPEDCRPAIPVLEAALAADTLTDPAPALRVLAILADADPMDVAPVTDTVTPYLHASEPATTRAATRCVAEVAAEDPGTVCETVPTLADSLAHDDPGSRWAAWALSTIAADEPDAVAPVADVLHTVVTDDDRGENVLVHAVAALGRVASDTPEAALPVVDRLAGFLEADHHKLRSNAVAALGEVAAHHADVVAPHVTAIAAHLDTDDEYGRVNATWTLARVARDHPAALGPVLEQVRSGLEDDVAQVRANTCYALGACGDGTVADRLATLQGRDPDESVRRAAQIAHNQLVDGP
ncbi:MAG: HEAT repeat domain-containing protein [Halobacteriaceae archaeon]